MNRLSQDQLKKVKDRFSYCPKSGLLLRLFKKGPKPAITDNPRKGSPSYDIVWLFQYKVKVCDLIYFLQTDCIADFPIKRIDTSKGYEWSNIRLYDASIRKTYHNDLILFNHKRDAWTIKNPTNEGVYKEFNTYKETVEELDKIVEPVVSPRKKFSLEERALAYSYAYRMDKTKSNILKKKRELYIKKLPKEHFLYKALYSDKTRKNITGEQISEYTNITQNASQIAKAINKKRKEVAETITNPVEAEKVNRLWYNADYILKDTNYFTKELEDDYSTQQPLTLGELKELEADGGFEEDTSFYDW